MRVRLENRSNELARVGNGDIRYHCARAVRERTNVCPPCVLCHTVSMKVVQAEPHVKLAQDLPVRANTALGYSGNSQNN